MTKNKIHEKAKVIFIVALSLCFLAFSNETFLFAAAPTITTGSASSITKTTAVLDATFSDGGSTVTDAGFEYGTTTSYGTSVTGVVSPYTNIFNFSTNDGTAGNAAPGQIDIDSNGFIYVSKFCQGIASKYDQTGNFIQELIHIGSCTLGGASALVVDQNNDILVVEQDPFFFPPFEVDKYDSDGNYLTALPWTGISSPTDNGGEFSMMSGLAVDSSGNVYMSDSGADRIQKFDSNYNFLFAFGWGVDTGGNQFEICMTTCRLGSSAGTQNGRFLDPQGIAVDASGNVYVADSGHDRIQKFNSSGVWQQNIGTSGSGDGNLDNPWDVDIDADGNIYVADRDNDRVEKFDSSGAFLTSITGVVTGLDTAGVDESNGRIFVTDTGHKMVKVYGPAVTTSPAISGLLCGTTYHFRAYATNADGTSYGNDNTFTTSACDTPSVTTTAAAQVGKTAAVLTGLQTSDGVSASTIRGFEFGTSTSYGITLNYGYSSSLSSTTFGTNGFGDQEFNFPDGIARGLDGTLYIADTGGHRIMVMDSSGNLIRMFGWGVATGAPAFEVCTSGCQGGLDGTGIGQFLSPKGVAVDNATGDIYVADTGNSRVQKFSSSGAHLQIFGTGVPGVGPGEFDSPVDLEVQSAGGVVTMFVLDSGENLGHPRVQKLNGSGTMLDAVGDFGSSSGQFNTPKSITLNSGGQYFYVADTFNARVQAINRTTMEATVVQFAEPSGWNPQSQLPGIATDSDDNLYISDPNNSRIIFAVQESDPFHYRLISEFTGLNQPDDLIVDNMNIVKAVDPSNSYISVLSPFFYKEQKTLTCKTTYHYRAFATNADGTAYGADEAFTTLPCGSTSGSGGGPSNPPPPVYGCVDPDATNYNPLANENDNSCTYPPGYFGCTDPTAINYDPAAIMDDGTCTTGGGPTPVLGCTNPNATNYNVLATTDDGSCTLPGGGGPENPTTSYGCTDNYAQNFNGIAELDDGSCTYPIPPGVNPPVTNPPRPLPPIITTIIGFVDDLPPPAKQAVKIVAVAGVAIPLIQLLAEKGFLANILSIPIRLWNLIPALLGFRRKKRPWGTVYDSVTKQPLDPVYVKLLGADGKEISTFITDLDGRYGFAVSPGTYYMSANKQSYVFPSEKMKGETRDELYDNLYFGETFETKDEDEIVNKNIPMDAINFNWNEFEKAKNKKLMKFYSGAELFWARIGKIIFIAGFVSSIALTFIEQSVFNYVILSLYVVIFILSLFGVKPKKPGFIQERSTGFPLSFGIISVFSALLNTEVGHAVIGKTGRYYLLVPKGNYYLKIKKKTGENSYEEVYTSDPFKVRKGYIGKVLKI